MDNQLEKTPELLWWAALSDLERYNLRKKYEISLYAIYEAEVLNIEQKAQECDATKPPPDLKPGNKTLK